LSQERSLHSDYYIVIAVVERLNIGFVILNLHVHKVYATYPDGNKSVFRAVFLVLQAPKLKRASTKNFGVGFS
jgi:hypothetical protein